MAVNIYTKAKEYEVPFSDDNYTGEETSDENEETSTPLRLDGYKIIFDKKIGMVPLDLVTAVQQTL